MNDESLRRTKERETPELLELARAMLHWDATTGKLWWKVKPSGAADVGDEAGSVGGKGYREISIKGVSVLAHRLIWALERGWPEGMLDHRDTHKDHNWLDNLREATRSGNGANRPAWGKKNGGFKGVVPKKQRSGAIRFQATLQKDKKRIHLGNFDTPQEAAAAYQAAALVYHGAFAHQARDDALKECT